MKDTPVMLLLPLLAIHIHEVFTLPQDSYICGPDIF